MTRTARRPTPSPLDRLIAAALSSTADPQLRAWLRSLERGDGAAPESAGRNQTDVSGPRSAAR